MLPLFSSTSPVLQYDLFGVSHGEISTNFSGFFHNCFDSAALGDMTCRVIRTLYE